MKHKLIIGLIVIALATGCHSVKTSVSRVSESRISTTTDSVSYRETVDLDTVRVRIDTVTMFVPYELLIRDTVWREPAPMVLRSGRASVSVLRQPKGIKITAQCDSLEMLLLNKTVEIINLKNTLSNLKLEMSRTDDSRVSVTRIPLWAILALVVSMALNGYFIFIKIKKRLLS